jgi:glycerophosphoryl diester phosphodiesterase
LFRILESVLFAPLAALAGKWLLGKTVLDSTAIISFLLSARGLLSLVLGVTTVLTIRLVEHAGLSAILFGALESRRISGRQALRLVWERLLDLVRVSARFVVLGILVALPLVVVAGGFAAWLLPRHDVNYYLKLRPSEFMVAATVIGVVAVLTIATIVALAVRWRWVVQSVLFEQKSVQEAFRRSAELTKGIRAKLTATLVAVSIFALLMGALGSMIGTASTSVVISVIGDGPGSLAVGFGVLLVLRTMITAIFTFFGACVDAGVFTFLYRGRLEALGGQAALPNLKETGEIPRWVPVGFVVALLFFAGGAVLLALEALGREENVTIHAHRGVATDAPENTLAALRASIAAGANYMETDVQLSKDGVLVIAHDSDFSRLGGVARKVWELTYEEIRAIKLRDANGSTSSEATPTLDALLAEAKGRIKLNLELKYYGDHQPGLAKKVVEAVRAHGMLDQVVIQCLEYEPLLEVRQLAPGVPLGYLLSFNAREPARLNVDFLSVEQNRADRRFITGAQRRGQQVYAWTVNKAEDMRRLLDLGIDGLITDQSALAHQTVTEHLNHSHVERSARRVRAWLSD